MNHDSVLAILRFQVEQFGTQKAFAEFAGVSPQHLTDVLKGRRAVTGRLLEKLGLKRVVRYETIGPAEDYPGVRRKLRC